MMDGYSVTEAASVLGVPTERVWELLARGVLAGRPEGESGMRVFLQPRAAAAPSPTREEPAPGNGSERGELSPFRELLTEFRSLTERYGQALLALGEARGEVASLRSRVDLLEARMELRLPMGATASGGAWMPPASAAEPARPIPAAASPEAAEDDEESHRTRRRGPRRATESFAEALDRADDPSVPDLLAGAESSDPTAADGESLGAVEPALPREVAPAEPMPVADEPQAAELDAHAAPGQEAPVALAEEAPVAVVEPVDQPAEMSDAATPAAPETFAEAPAVAASTEEPTEAVAAPDAVPEPEEPVAAVVDASDAPTETDATDADLTSEPEAADLEQADRAVVAVPAVPADVASAPEDVGAETAAGDASPEPEPVAEVDAIDYDERRYTAAIEEPDWFAAEVDLDPLAAAEPPDSESGPVGGEATAESSPAAEVGAEVAEAAGEPEDTDQPGSADRADEETVLSFAAAEAPSGADEMEVVGPSAGFAADPAEPEALPGADELDRALAALAEGGGATAAGRADPEWPPRAGVAEVAPVAERPRPAPSVADALRHRPVMPAGPATRAYRRLRRIFPE